MSTFAQGPWPYPFIQVVNFGAIRRASLQLTPLLVFIGPQGSGKSTLARLTYFFHKLGTLFIDSVIQHYDPKNPEFNADHFKEALASELNNIFEHHFWSSQETSIAYEWNKGLKLTITSSEDGKPIVQFNEAFLQQLNRVGASDKEESTVTYLVEDVRSMYGPAKRLSNELLDSARHIFKFIAPPVYMEPEYHQLGYLWKEDLLNDKDNLPYLSQTYFNIQLAALKIHKLPDIDILKSTAGISYTSAEYFDNQLKLLLGGGLSVIDHKLNIKEKDGRLISLAQAGSGKRALVGLLLQFGMAVLKDTPYQMTLESPEHPLYPEAQKTIAEVLVFLLNVKHTPVCITTNSPYLLAALNTLIYAHAIGQQNSDYVEKVIPNMLWLNKQDVSALKIENGETSSIMDSELPMIQNEAIDTASTQINNEFDYLLEYE